jgi:hypothetical protein
VRWLLAGPGVEPGAPWTPVLDGPGGRVWQRPRALPLLFLPAAAEIYRGGGWQQAVWDRPDFVASTLVAPSPGHGDDWRAAGGAGAPAAVDVVALSATRIAARAALAAERLMASSVYQDGGWRVLIDGEPRPLLLANGPLVAAWLPAGDHRVELLYRPGRLVAGLALAGLALAAAAAGGLAPGRLTRPAPGAHRGSVREPGVEGRPPATAVPPAPGAGR